ncbi:MAG: hypothetical protein E6J78_16935 [Deltaproteobacteria bacterium]|nr:MAG: hypothetical protein E6J78_16935 [Deltaproteobacteria bacterium]
MRTAVLISTLLCAATATSKLRQDAEEKARAEVTDLFRALCPEQCLLLSVEARIGEEDLPEPAPGFDAPGARSLPVLRGVAATLLLDARLPAEFRARMKALVAQRLKALGAPPAVAVEVVQFPPPRAQAEAAPPPQPPQPSVASATPVAANKPEEKLMEHAPLLAVVTLLGTVLLVLGALLFLAARRNSDVSYEVGPEPQPQPAASAKPAEAPVADPFPIQRTHKLEKALLEQRGLRNAVVREALGRGEHALVARWIRELGEFLLEDLRGDVALAPALQQVGAELVRGAGPDRSAGLLELEGRTIAARLTRAPENIDEAFAFLEGVRAEPFLAACRGLSPASLEAALRFAPAHLRGAALAELPVAQRQQIALSWARLPEVSAAVALTAADELRARLGESAGAGQAVRALADVLDSLGRAEQDALVESMRRDGGARAAAGLWVESALLSANPDALAAALLGTPANRLADYLRGADPAVRDHLLAACPVRLRKELEEELSLRSTSTREEFAAARRELLARLAEETARRGPALTRPERPRLVVE